MKYYVDDIKIDERSFWNCVSEVLADMPEDKKSELCEKIRSGKKVRINKHTFKIGG